MIRTRSSRASDECDRNRVGEIAAANRGALAENRGCFAPFQQPFPANVAFGSILLKKSISGVDHISHDRTQPSRELSDPFGRDYRFSAYVHRNQFAGVLSNANDPRPAKAQYSSMVNFRLFQHYRPKAVTQAMARGLPSICQVALLWRRLCVSLCPGGLAPWAKPGNSLPSWSRT
jgi:hypothetical protein